MKPGYGQVRNQARLSILLTEDWWLVYGVRYMYVALHARGGRTDAQTCQDWNAKVGNQDRDSSEYEISIGIVGL